MTEDEKTIAQLLACAVVAGGRTDWLLKAGTVDLSVVVREALGYVSCPGSPHKGIKYQAE